MVSRMYKELIKNLKNIYIQIVEIFKQPNVR